MKLQVAVVAGRQPGRRTRCADGCIVVAGRGGHGSTPDRVLYLGDASEQMPVNARVVAVILAQRAAHIRAEHLFGPDYARALVDCDLVTIEKLVANAPSHLRGEVRRAAGRIAELGGWIAQDSGDPVKADQLTRRAADHVRGADPDLRAMIAMRRSNILLTRDPALAVELAAEAAQLIAGRSVGRLEASIARQQALAGMADHDRSGFMDHAARALDVAQTEPVLDDHPV